MDRPGADRTSRGWPPTLNIRSKIVLPYLVLTLVVAAVGTYVVTSLVAGSLDERLTNHLLEAGRVVSDMLVEREQAHLRAARLVAFTRGLAEAVEGGDREELRRLGLPVASGLETECLVITDAEGQALLHALRLADGTVTAVEDPADLSGLWLVQTLLEGNDPDSLPSRGIGRYPVDQRYYYFSAIPVGLEGRLVGVVIVGTSLDTLLPFLKQTSLADVTIHIDDGRAIASTFALGEPPDQIDALLDALSISTATFQEILQSTGTTIGEDTVVRERWYRIARGPISIGGQRLGVFGVALPLNFILRAGATSRNTYALLFAAVMICVVLVGYAIARRITGPLGQLVRTTQAIADGNLQQRTGIVSGDEIGMLASTFDEMAERLAERTRALEELLQAYKESAGRMRSILASIGDGVILEDLDGNFIPLNAAAESLLQELAESFQFGPLRELSVSEEAVSPNHEANPWLLESRRFEVGRKVISAHSAAVRTDEGERLGTVIVLRNVTAEAEADRLKDAFIAHVSHELRTPLTAIKGYVTLLLRFSREALTEEQARFLETINRHTDSLISMINTLLDFSEMEAGGRLGVQRRPMMLSHLVNEIAQEWWPEMEEKGLKFHVEVGEELPLVDADAQRLRWAIVNLLRNAWQYTPAGGEVWVRLYANQEYVVLEVRDTGVGIPADQLEHLFDRFYRLANQRDEEVRGLGLGLYVTRAIVNAHDGEIQVESHEGAGSTFRILLPVSQTGGRRPTTPARDVGP